VDLASDRKAVDIVLLRTTEVTTMADYFVICTGRSDRQLQALASGILDELRDEGIRPLGIEGKGAARWVRSDYGSVIVHLRSGGADSDLDGCGAMPHSRAWSDRPQVLDAPFARRRTSLLR
jgi:ribosome silencing factor RsfS/YbeB/iojap